LTLYPRDLFVGDSLFPTSLSMCGIDMPENLYVDGENIIEVLKGNQ
jgi:hypothetical protein